MAIAVVYAGWIFLGRRASERRWYAAHQPAPRRSPAFDSVYGGTALKIAQFYARDGDLTEGERTVICYGLVNARSVRIEPPVEGVEVSPNRCVEVAPEHDTRYTLTAEGTDGRTVSESFLLRVHADPETLPQITSFRIAKRKADNPARPTFLLAFTARNGEEISIDPAVFPTLHGAAFGQFYVAPEKTTTYTLTVTGKRGRKARQQLTIEVPPK